MVVAYIVSNGKGNSCKRVFSAMRRVRNTRQQCKTDFQIWHYRSYTDIIDRWFSNFFCHRAPLKLKTKREALKLYSQFYNIFRK